MKVKIGIASLVIVTGVLAGFSVWGPSGRHVQTRATQRETSQNQKQEVITVKVETTTTLSDSTEPAK